MAERFHWPVTAAATLIAITVGYFLGREHIKYELRSAMSEAGKAFSEGLQESFGQEAKEDRDERMPAAVQSPEAPSIAAETPKSEPPVQELIEVGQAFVTPDFEISIVRARIDHPDVLDMFGQKGRAKSPDLLLTFRVKNTHDRKILRFREDNAFLASNFKLRDDVENVIRGINYGIGNQPVGALTGNEDILPGKEATHIEAFGVPPPKTKFLILSVDLVAFGGEGVAHFRIPAERIENFSP